MSFKAESEKANAVRATQLSTPAHDYSTIVYRLSERNLRTHDASFSKQETDVRVNLIQQDVPHSVGQSSNGQAFGDMDDDWEDEDFNIYSEEISVQRAASLEALKVYAGAFTSSKSDLCAGIAKEMLDDSIRFGDLDRLDMGQLASEMVNIEVTLDDTQGSSIGSPSPCPSSDTLSVSRNREIICARKEGTKNRKRIGVRRRDTLDRERKPRSTIHGTTN